MKKIIILIIAMISLMLVNIMVVAETITVIDETNDIGVTEQGASVQGSVADHIDITEVSVDISEGKVTLTMKVLGEMLLETLYKTSLDYHIWLYTTDTCYEAHYTSIPYATAYGIEYNKYEGDEKWDESERSESGEVIQNSQNSFTATFDVTGDTTFVRLFGRANAGAMVDYIYSDDWLANAIMSEASIGTEEERRAVGCCVLNRLVEGNYGKTIEEVVKNGFAYNQEATYKIHQLSNILKASISYLDETKGATYFFSPRSMPKEGEDTEGYDVGGGLHIVPGTSYSFKVYFPSWAKPTKEIDGNTKSYQTTAQLEWTELDDIRSWYFMFYHPISSQYEPEENSESNNGSPPGAKTDGTPGFELILMVISLSFFLLWKKRQL